MDISKTKFMAALSEASYADFRAAEQPDGSYRGSDVKTALIAEDFSETQAEEFVTQWRVADHQPNTDTGFSATVFESIEHPGEFVFAMRGTELGAQWGTDLTLADIADIGADGIALNQAVDLFNYYQRLTTADTDQAVQYEIYEGIIPPPSGTTEFIQLDDGIGPLGAPRYRYLRTTAPANGLGVLPESGSTIDVTGHSLGGHLALIMSRLDPDGTNMTYTYNAPGFDTGIIGSDDTEWFFRAMAEAETNETGATTVGDFPLSRISNLVVPEDVVSDIGLLPGGTISHFSEVDATTAIHTAASAHSIINVTDALAVYDLLAQLDPDVDLGAISKILQAASATANSSLEATIAAVGLLFGEQFPSTETPRDTLYQNIQKLTKENALFRQATGLVSIESLTDKNSIDLTYGVINTGKARRQSVRMAA